MQLLTSLLSGLKAVNSTFPDARKGRGGNIEIADFGLSAFSMFFMEAYSVDSGCSTCSVLSGGNLAATRNFFDGSGPFACAIPEGLL